MSAYPAFCIIAALFQIRILGMATDRDLGVRTEVDDEGFTCVDG